MPHGHHGGRDVHVVSRTGTDVVGVPDVVRRPATWRSAMEDQVGPVILDHDLRCGGTPFWDKARPCPVCRCRFIVRVIGRVLLRSSAQAHEVRGREPVVGSSGGHEGRAHCACKHEVLRCVGGLGG